MYNVWCFPQYRHNVFLSSDPTDGWWREVIGGGAIVSKE